tara:strand:- start:1559 stop:1843 length:285 start_codon:yes stop_codon:yes gene_type:complete
MNKIIQATPLGITLAFVAKTAILGGTWQQMLALSVSAAVCIAIIRIQDSKTLKELAEDGKEYKKELDQISSDLMSLRSEMSALRINKGIGTRRL